MFVRNVCTTVHTYFLSLKKFTTMYFDTSLMFTGGGNINGDIFSQLLRKRVRITGTTLRVRQLEVLVWFLNYCFEKYITIYKYFL